MHLPSLIQDLAVILGVAAIVAFFFQKIRQPVVLGYIIAGIIVGPHTPPATFIQDIESIRTWAELGVIFLMFSLGLEFSFRKLFRTGSSASVTAVLEVVLMMALGYGTGKLLGWSGMDSLFLGAMLSVSSTTIIIKALDELGLKTKHFAEVIFAILIVEDLLAILLLVFLTAIAQEGSVSGLALLSSGAKLGLIVGSWFLFGYFLIPQLVKSVARSGTSETLLILSLGLCLGLVVFAAHFEYSAALGAFIMGSIISESRESHRIEEIMVPIRDLFGAIFFVSVGMLIDPRTLLQHGWAIVIIAGVTIFGKIFTTTLGSLLTGQTTRNSVRVGFSLAQIGEFSFIIAGLGMSLKVIGDQVYPIGVAVSLLTTFTTPYLIRISGTIGSRAEAAMSPRLRKIQDELIVWTQERRGDPEARRRFQRSLMRWLASGILVTVTFILVAEYLLPLLPQRWLGWAACVLLASPFIWSMLASFRLRSGERGRSFLSRSIAAVFFDLVTLFLIGTLSAKFFPTRYALISTGVGSVAILFFFRRNLEVSYHWFERRFLAAFESDTETGGIAGVAQESTARFQSLAPWDAHLVKVRVHPSSELVGKSLLQSELRTRHGVNVVVIQRGDVSIVAPGPAELIYPQDELLTLGTDEQLEKIRAVAQPATPAAKDATAPSSYEMRAVRITQDSVLAHRSIRDSGLRSQFMAMVVGMERNGHRVNSPDSDAHLLPGDLLWVVGPKLSLDQLK